MTLSISQMALMSQLLDEALPLDADGRRAWLNSLSPEHHDLAPALWESLLPDEAQVANHQALATLPKLGSAAAEANAPAARGLQPGARIGPYEMIRLLGAGGMAEVWLARRADGAFRREIALKLPMRYRLQSGLEARFARERDILASLEHTHIARLYDAGVDSEGWPYLSMEYVRGESMTIWCDKHGLGIHTRLALFLQVLEAVQYAHEKRVIHRDLKPSNILVTETGQVRLLDFGVAKLLDADNTDQAGLTSIYGRALTPDYASPELLRGDPIDGRSDLYSLGVLLYELLSGTRPYRLKGAASLGLLDQAIATLEAKKPSTQLEQPAAAARVSTVEQLARQLRGDLDAIVLKALAKEPAQRYPSAAAMADDLRRYLDGKPIRAQPARVVYRLRKFVLRNKALLAVIVVALIAIIATVGYTLYRERLVQITANTAATQLLSDKSIAVLPFIDMSEKKDQEYFADGLSEELIDLLTKVPELRVPARTSSFYFKGKPTPITDIAKALNVVNVLEGSVRKSGNALRITAHLIRVDTGYDVWSQSYDRDLKDIFQVQDEIAGAVAQALKAQLLTDSVSNNRTANTEAYSLFLQGRYLNARASEKELRRAAQLLEQTVKLDPGFAPAWAELANSYVALALDAESPATFFEAGRVATHRALSLNPADAASHYSLAQIKISFDHDWKGAVAEMEAGRRADPNITELLDVQLAGCTSGPCHDKFMRDISRDIDRDPLNAVDIDNRGFVHYISGELEAAESDVRRALELSPDLQYGKFDLVRILVARHELAQALTVLESMLDTNYRRVGFALVYQLLGRKAEADAALQELLAKDSKGGPYEIALAYSTRGDIPSALDWLQRDYDLRLNGIIYAKVDPLLRPLAHEPRFVALMKKFGPIN